MKTFAFALVVALYIVPLVFTQPAPSEEFPHHAILDSRSENVLLYWKFDDETITFEMIGRTAGWVGFGISPTGGMIGADMFVGWVKDGAATITDRHGTDRNTFPPMSEQQDVTLLGGKEENGWTRIKFRRPLAGCETDYDITITTSTLKVIWALGGSDPVGDDITRSDYHGVGLLNRGVRSLFLLEASGGSAITRNIVPDTKKMDLLNTMTQVPAKDTFYACELFKVPDFVIKNHVISVEPVIENGNEDIVHHILAYQCSGKPQNSSNLGTTHECFTDNMPDDFEDCAFVIHAWAIGGGKFYYPENAGFPLGAADSPRYIMLETHYDNPAKRSGIVDSSGLRFIYTDRLRQYDAGVLEVGHLTYPFSFIIPPKTSSFELYAECNPECASKGMAAINRSDIRLFGAFLHTHLLGKAITLHHITENGTSELPFIAQDQSYDFNYQEVKVFNKEVVFKQGESMQVVCKYDSMGRTNLTLGGLRTKDEMCLVFIYYYPRMPMTACLTFPFPHDLYTFFGVTQFLNPTPRDERGRLDVIQIVAPESLKERNFGSLVNQVLSNKSEVERFGEFIRFVPRLRTCRITNTTGRFTYGLAPVIENPYRPQPPKCPSSAGWSRISFSLAIVVLVFNLIMLLL